MSIELCAYCGKPLRNSPSEWFCSQSCQGNWFSERAVDTDNEWDRSLTAALRAVYPWLDVPDHTLWRDLLPVSPAEVCVRCGLVTVVASKKEGLAVCSVRLRHGGAASFEMLVAPHDQCLSVLGWTWRREHLFR